MEQKRGLGQVVFVYSTYFRWCIDSLLQNVSLFIVLTQHRDSSYNSMHGMVVTKQCMHILWKLIQTRHAVRMHLYTSFQGVRAPIQTRCCTCNARIFLAEDERWPGMAIGHVLFRVPLQVQSQLSDHVQTYFDLNLNVEETTVALHSDPHAPLHPPASSS